MQNFIRNCPKCFSEIEYKIEWNFLISLEKNGVCKKCKNKEIKEKAKKEKKFSRKCPDCKKEILYTDKFHYEMAIVKNRVCVGCSNNRKILFSYNENFFETYNLKSCYWAGFIAADGNINKNLKTLKITLSKKDIEHLELLKKDIAYNGNITIYKDCRNIYKGCEHKEYATLSIISQKICNDLKDNFNIVPNKTLTYTPPAISGEFALAFIIGYIDGDGSVFKYMQKDLQLKTEKEQLCIKVAGTFDMLSFIKEYFDTKFPFKRYPNSKFANVKKHYKSKCFTYQLMGNRAKLIYESLNSFDIEKLERKWNI